MLRKLIALVSLLAGMLAACTVTAHGHPVPVTTAPAAGAQMMAVPANVLTGQGAVVTADGCLHW